MATLEDYMSGPMTVVTPTDTISHVRNLMLTKGLRQFGVGDLPVIQNNNLIGLPVKYNISGSLWAGSSWQI